MSYALQAIIGSRESLADVRGSRIPYVELGDDLRMAPLTSEVRERFGIPFLPFDDAADLTMLPDSIDALCRRLSPHGLVAYVEAAFWGGAGMQVHVRFKDGAALGPPAVADDAINQALRWLGIKATAPKDEFDVVGLGRLDCSGRWRYWLASLC
jgi:hypothetical protein